MYNLGVIPRFPIFKKLTIQDKDEIEAFVKQYPPYSDYNFVSLWCWNTKDSVEISILNDNLVVKFLDYFGAEHYYSFLGNKKAEQTIDTLLTHSQKNNIAKKLILIPEINLSFVKRVFSNFLITEDENNFDYILSVNEIYKLTGNKFGSKRNFVNRFIKKYPEAAVDVFDINNPKLQRQIESLFFTWEKQTNKNRSETNNELTAVQRLLKSASNFDLICTGIFMKNQLIAYSIDEILKNNYAIIHFEKADASCIGIFQYLKQQTARHLKRLGCKYINYEQDLGITGLRKAKKSWYPVEYLKKYIVSKKK